MRFIRFITAALAACSLVIAAGCKSSYSQTTTTTTPASQTSATSTYSTDNSSTPSSTSTTTSSSSTAYPSSTTTVAQSTTSTDQSGATTTKLPDGTSITKSESTTVVYPDGRVEKLTGTASSSLTSPSGVPTLPPGAQVVTQTKMTVTTKPGEPVVTTASVPVQPIYITTTPANIPMTSSTTSTSIYRPVPSLRGRRFPNVNFLVFADRASFSNRNDSIRGSVDTGVIGTDIRHQEGWGLGFNTYLGRTNLSTEFTASQIRPRATLTPANANFNPITDFRIKMTPITGTLQLHWNPRSSVDFFVGGGGAYVMLKPDNSFNPGTTGLTSVRFRDEWGPLVNAGLGFGFSPNFGINFDAKYMWIRANARTTFTETTLGNVGNSERIGLNPLVLSAGLRFGF